jgi:hypothetical protein
MARDKDELDTWLESLNTMYHGSVKTTTRTSVKVIQNPVVKELLNINLDSLFELYGNLILAGFEKDEAITIIVSLIRGYEQRTA